MLTIFDKWQIGITAFYLSAGAITYFVSGGDWQTTFKVTALAAVSVAAFAALSAFDIAEEEEEKDLSFSLRFFRALPVADLLAIAYRVLSRKVSEPATRQL